MIENGVIANIISKVEVIPQGVLNLMSFRRGDVGTDIHAHTALCEEESRDGNDIPTSWVTPKLATKPGESKGEAWNQFSITAALVGVRC